MHLPGLRDDVDFDGAGTPPRLLDKKYGRRLELTGIESQLVVLYSGGVGPEQLTERARAQGVAVELPQVAAFLDRLSRAGFIPKVKIPQPPPDVPAPLKATDPLPKFRPDLSIVPSASSAGLIQVVDPTRDRSFTLYDFEASVAQMLDGRRNADEIIEIAGRIGIPVTFGSLKSFVRQMAAYGFLAPEGPAPGSAPVRPPRRPWTPDVRELFQGALRLFRSGKPKEALDYLAALLQVDPENAEAIDLKQRIEGQPEVDLNFDIMHEEPEPAAEDIPLADGDFEEVAESPQPEPALEPSAPPVDGDFPPAFGLLQGLAAERPPGRGRWIIGGCGVAVAGCLLWPVSTKVDVPCELEPVSVATITAPRDGEIASRPVTAGTAIKAQQVLATLATDDLKKQLEEGQHRLAGERTKADRLRRKAKPAAGAKLKRKLDQRKKALDQALAAETKWKAVDQSPNQKRQLAKASHQVAAAKAAFAALDKKYQALTAEAAIAAVQGQISADQAELQRLQGLIATSVIAAPAAGIFLPSAEGASPHLTKDQPYGRIVKPDVLHLIASPPASVAKGDLEGAVLLLPAGRKGELRGLAWMGAPDDGKLEATIEGAALEPGSQPGATLQLPTGLRPLLWKLLQ